MYIYNFFFSSSSSKSGHLLSISQSPPPAGFISIFLLLLLLAVWVSLHGMEGEKKNVCCVLFCWPMVSALRRGEVKGKKKKFHIKVWRGSQSQRGTLLSRLASSVGCLILLPLHTLSSASHPATPTTRNSTYYPLREREWGVLAITHMPLCIDVWKGAGK